MNPRIYTGPRMRFINLMKDHIEDFQANMKEPGYVTARYLDGFAKTVGGKTETPKWISKDPERTKVDGMIYVGDLLAEAIL